MVLQAKKSAQSTAEETGFWAYRPIIGSFYPNYGQRKKKFLPLHNEKNTSLNLNQSAEPITNSFGLL